MITGFDLHTAPLTDDEKTLVPIIIKGLYTKRSPDNAVFGAYICDRVTKLTGIRLTEPRLRKIINFLRSSKILPVMATSRGYYVSDNKDEIAKQITSLEQRRDAIQSAIDGLKLWL